MLYDASCIPVLQWQNYKNGGQTSGWQGSGKGDWVGSREREVSVSKKGQHGRGGWILVVMEMFSVLTVSLSIMVMISRYSFIRCYHGGNWGKGIQDLSMISYTYKWIYSYLKKRSLKNLEFLSKFSVTLYNRQRLPTYSNVGNLKIFLDSDYLIIIKIVKYIT